MCTKLDIFVFITITVEQIPLLVSNKSPGYHTPSRQCFNVVYKFLLLDFTSSNVIIKVTGLSPSGMNYHSRIWLACQFSFVFWFPNTFKLVGFPILSIADAGYFRKVFIHDQNQIEYNIACTYKGGTVGEKLEYHGNRGYNERF